MVVASRRNSSCWRYVERGRRLPAAEDSRSSGRSSIKLEAAEPVGTLMVIQRTILLTFTIQKPISNHQAVNLRRHEATVRVFHVVDDWLATHVERRVDDHAAAGSLTELREHLMHERIAVAINRL